MQGRLQPNTRILVRVIRDELRRLLDRLVEVGVGEDEAAAVLVDVVVSVGAGGVVEFGGGGGNGQAQTDGLRGRGG